MKKFTGFIDNDGNKIYLGDTVEDLTCLQVVGPFMGHHPVFKVNKIADLVRGSTYRKIEHVKRD